MDKYTEIINQIQEERDKNKKQITDLKTIYGKNNEPVYSLNADLGGLKKIKEVLESKHKKIFKMVFWGSFFTMAIAFMLSIPTVMLSYAHEWPIVVPKILETIYLIFGAFISNSILRVDYKKDIEIFKNYNLEDILQKIEDKENTLKEINDKNNDILYQISKLVSKSKELSKDLKKVLDSRDNAIKNVFQDNRIEEKINNVFDADDKLDDIKNSYTLKRTFIKEEN